MYIPSKIFFFPIFRLKHSMNRIQNHCPLLSVKSNKPLKVNYFTIRQCLACSLKTPLDYSYHHARSLWNFCLFVLNDMPQLPGRYLAQVIYAKNCPTTFYCIFKLVWAPMTTTQNIRVCFLSSNNTLFS